MIRPNHIGLLALLLVSLNATAAAQQLRSNRTPVTEPFGEDIDVKRTEGLTVVQQREAERNIMSVLDVFRRNPHVNSPAPLVCTRLIAAVPLLLWQGRLSTYAGVGVGKRKDAQRCYGVHGLIYVGDVMVEINDPSELIKDAGTHNGVFPYEIGLAELPTGEFRGHPVYGDCCIVFTHGRAPILLPVSRGDYLQGRITILKQELLANEKLRTQKPPISTSTMIPWPEQKKQMVAAMQKQLAEMERNKVPAERIAETRKNYEKMIELQEASSQQMREAVAKAEADFHAKLGPGIDRLAQIHSAELSAKESELAGMSAGERNAPACLGGDGFVECSTSRAHLKYVNPAYFDKSNKSGIQLLVLIIPTYNRYAPKNPPPGSFEAQSQAIDETQRKIMETLDLNALALLVR